MTHSRIDKKLKTLNLQLAEAMQLPEGLVLPFVGAKILGKRVVISGHLPLNTDGSIHEIRGKVGDEVSIEEAYLSAKLATLAMLGTLKRTIGSLDRVENWVRILGMVNVTPGCTQTAPVINGCSDLLIELFGPEVGSHTRSAVGFAELPF
ncbi:unnamed protein product, partial [Scytosiphon promiscuus]